MLHLVNSKIFGQNHTFAESLCSVIWDLKAESRCSDMPSDVGKSIDAGSKAPSLIHYIELMATPNET